MRTRKTALATAIALTLATSWVTVSGPVWADTSTRTIQTVFDRTPNEAGIVTVIAGETLNLAGLGLDQLGKVDSRGEQLGATLFMAVSTQKGQIFFPVGSDTPGETERDPDPRIGGFDFLQDLELPFNNLKYVRTVQGLGRVNIYYPPHVNTPPVVDLPAIDNRDYDECCFLPCGEKVPEGVLNCPTDDRDEAITLDPVEDIVTITLQERFRNAQGGVEYKIIQSLEKKVHILPYLPRTRKLEIVSFTPAPKDPLTAVVPAPTTNSGERAKQDKQRNEVCVGKTSVAQDLEPCVNALGETYNGIHAEITAGYKGAMVVVHALRDSANAERGVARDRAANGKVVLKIVSQADRSVYMELPPVDMLNGEAKIVLPAGITKAGDYYLEAELYLAVNGHIDPSHELALTKYINNVDMFTTDELVVKATGNARKLKLESVKSVISDDANHQLAPKPLWNAATPVKVYVLDEYGNKTVLSAGTATKVKIVDNNGVVNAGTLNLDFANGALTWASDWLGQDFGDVLKLGDTALVASIENNPAIQPSDPLKIKVVQKSLVARPYAGTNVQGDMAYGVTVAKPEPAPVTANLPAGAPCLNPAATPYQANTANVVNDIQAGNQFKAFSVALDGGQTNGIPNGSFEDYINATNQKLPNLADGNRSDDDFVSRTSPTILVIKTPAGETVETTVAQPMFNPDGTVAELVQADGTVGQGARIETLFSKAATQFNAKGEPNYFVIGDKAGLYGETLVCLPGSIKPSAASQGKILNGHGYEPVLLDDEGNPVLDENGQPIIALEPTLDRPKPDGTYQVVLPESAVQLGDAYGNSPTAGAGGSFTPSTSNGQPSVMPVDEYGEPTTLGGTLTGIRAADGVFQPGVQPDTTGQDAYVLSYNPDTFAGTDRVTMNFTSPGVKPRTIEVVIPQKSILTEITTEVETLELPVNSVVAVTIRSFDQYGFPIDALGDTTLNFSGSILRTATVWRLEDEAAEADADGQIVKWQPMQLLKSGDIIRPEGILNADGSEVYPGGDHQVLIVDIGNKEGEFTLTFNNPDLGQPATVTFKASESYVDPSLEVCSIEKPELCDTQEKCVGAGGTWNAETSQCTLPIATTKDACEQEGGVYALNKCYVVPKEGVEGEVTGIPSASSGEGASYGDDPSENAEFFGGVLVTKGARSQDGFENPTEISLGDDVKVAGVIKVEEQDKGKKADIVVGAFHMHPAYDTGFTWYMMVDCSGNDFTTVPTCPSFGWKIDYWPYDENGMPILSLLRPLESVTLPTTGYYTVEMYQGNFVYPAEPDPMQVFFGYILREGDDKGKVVYSGEPLSINIKSQGGDPN